jgi:hypothetical protein
MKKSLFACEDFNSGWPQEWPGTKTKVFFIGFWPPKWPDTKIEDA